MLSTVYFGNISSCRLFW